MNSSKLFLTVGLAFSTIGALVLLIPSLNPWKHISEEEIIGAKDSEAKYIQGKDLKTMITSIVGFILLFVGFVLQLIGTVLS